MYDFRYCKLCSSADAAPYYRLKRSTLYRCPVCDFHYIDHLDQHLPETKATQDSGLTDRDRSFIASRLGENARKQSNRLAFLRQHLDPMQCRLLDIGAGAGLFLWMATDAGAIPSGIEPNPLLRAFAAEAYRIELTPETLDDPLWQMNFSEHFTAATLWDVIEHVDFPVELLEKTYHVLAPGGMLLLDTPSRDSLYYNLATLVTRLAGESAPLGLNAFYAPIRYGHKQIFRPAQLITTLQRIGFEVVTLQGGYVCGGWRGAVTSCLQPRDKIVLACRKPKPPTATSQ